MEIEELAAWLKKENEQIQADLECLCLSTESNESTESIESALSRIEKQLTEVHGHTGTLIERVPENLAVLLAEVKESVLARIDSLKQQPTESTESMQSNKSVQNKDDWGAELLSRLTPQERNLFKACFGGGLITYRELAARLNINPISAKNIVNQLFQNPNKRRLFRKEHIRGIAKVGVNETVEQKILHKKGKNSANKKKPKFIFEDHAG